ncbi:MULTISPECIES: DUF4134 domain-containing protein [Chitinophaga]|uniref:DUF4134 domain-containing protein n=1 Tax=Chitinophaga pollutisoli TaxID=3133966 RepID=A0ABZ2YMT7_9BACT|nr:DUF4134 domain-containing protein [Chitinophaga rhizosphaerae]
MKLLNSYGQKARWQAIAIVLLSASISANAQDGVAGIEQANDMVREYFDTGITLLYAIGAVLGLVGAVKVYTRWSQGDTETTKLAASWFGACIFLVVVATVLKSFFGV